MNLTFGRCRHCGRVRTAVHQCPIPGKVMAEARRIAGGSWEVTAVHQANIARAAERRAALQRLSG